MREQGILQLAFWSQAATYGAIIAFAALYQLLGGWFFALLPYAAAQVGFLSLALISKPQAVSPLTCRFRLRPALRYARTRDHHGLHHRFAEHPPVHWRVIVGTRPRRHGVLPERRVLFRRAHVERVLVRLAREVLAAAQSARKDLRSDLGTFLLVELGCIDFFFFFFRSFASAGRRIPRLDNSHVPSYHICPCSLPLSREESTSVMVDDFCQVEGYDTVVDFRTTQKLIWYAHSQYKTTL